MVHKRIPVAPMVHSMLVKRDNKLAECKQDAHNDERSRSTSQVPLPALLAAINGQIRGSRSIPDFPIHGRESLVIPLVVHEYAISRNITPSFGEASTTAI